MKSIVPSVKGTRDFYPEIMAVRTWMVGVIRQVSEQFGYQEYEAPFLEKIDLYAAKSGEELVNQQSFVFQDRGGEWLTLRPELTPSLARMVAQKQSELVFPLRWWSFGPFWRYERPQKGRTREFFQWNIDLIGSSTPEADAELIAICATFFKTVGITAKQVQILVNDRRLMDAELENLNFGSLDKKQIFRLIDRQDKLGPDEWANYGLELGLNQDQIGGIRKILADQDLWKNSTSLRRVFAVLEAMGLKEYVNYDAHIIRGLDYYTGTVFEAKDLDGGRSLLGGGRYDNLLGDVGGDPLSGVGFAMGDVMAPLVLQKYGCIPSLSATPSGILVTVFDETRLASAFGLGANLRRAGLKVVVYPEAAKLQKQLKYADRVGLRFVVIAGPDEEARGEVTVKDLVGRNQQTVASADAGKIIIKMLADGTGV
jgi:histidyl-tRNA synthetase